MAGIRITDKAMVDELIKKGLIKGDQISVAQQSIQGGGQKVQSSGVKLPPASVTGLIPTAPADILYQAVVRRFGRFYEGGLAVYELEFPFDSRKLRADIAMPEYRLVLELDGWASHGKTLNGFKRDRAKSLTFERRGWSVVRFSNEQIRSDLPDVLLAVEQILGYRQRDKSLRDFVKPTGFDRSVFVVDSAGNEAS